MSCLRVRYEPNWDNEKIPRRHDEIQCDIPGCEHDNPTFATGQVTYTRMPFRRWLACYRLMTQLEQKLGVEPSPEYAWAREIEAQARARKPT